MHQRWLSKRGAGHGRGPVAVHPLRALAGPSRRAAEHCTSRAARTSRCAVFSQIPYSPTWTIAPVTLAVGPLTLANDWSPTMRLASEYIQTWGLCFRAARCPSRLVLDTDVCAEYEVAASRRSHARLRLSERPLPASMSCKPGLAELQIANPGTVSVGPWPLTMTPRYRSKTTTALSSLIANSSDE